MCESSSEVEPMCAQDSISCLSHWGKEGTLHSQSLRGFIIKMEKQTEGCGKFIQRDFPEMSYICGNGDFQCLCPECQSQQDEIESRDDVKSQKGSSFFHKPADTQTPFNLKEKLFSKPYITDKEVEEVKEFIRLLKENKICSICGKRGNCILHKKSYITIDERDFDKLSGF